MNLSKQEKLALISDSDPFKGESEEQLVHFLDGKYNICKRCTPNRILEIGVRAGYSARAFLEASPQAEYVGLDAYDLLEKDPGDHTVRHGGVQDNDLGWLINWRDELLKTFDATVHKLNTQAVTDLKEYGIFDFIHVDGDHTHDGALHDLNMVLELLGNNGVILVDDYDHIIDVRTAVDQFHTEHPELEYEYIPSFRGDVIFTKTSEDLLDKFSKRFGEQ